MTHAIWRVLPPGVHHLACSTRKDPVVGEAWEQRASVRSLVLAGSVDPYDEQSSGRVGVSALAVLLAAAPNISTCHLDRSAVIEATFSSADGHSVSVLEARLGAGLVLSGVQQMFWLPPRGSGGVTLRFDALNARSDRKPMCNIKDVEFHNEDGGLGVAADLTHLPRVFPNVMALTINNMYVQGSDARALLSCAALRGVTFVAVGGFGAKELRMLCAESKVLRSVALHGCEGVTAKERRRIVGNKGVTRLSGVEVTIENDDEGGGWSQWG
ncbi:MAG: hypothetical protein WDW38_010050 [Sanguina aurantia]